MPLQQVVVHEERFRLPSSADAPACPAGLAHPVPEGPLDGTN